MNTNRTRGLIVIILSVLWLLGHSICGFAQMKGDHLLGDFGLAAGTQPSPSIVAALPLYGYNASRLVNNDGDVIDKSPDVNAFLLGAGASVVTKLKLLGANYGASLLFCFASNKIEGNSVQSSSSFAFSDTYIQPLQLGWHLKQADITVGYGLYMPTGKYEFGGDDNSGMGMWTNEFSVGGTWYMDKKKSFNLSSIIFYEIHSDKKGTDVRVGDILTLEGGLAKAFDIPMKGSPIPMVINVGPVYYAQFKVGKDRIPLDNQIFSGNRDHIYGLGLEGNILFPKTFTSLSVRWLEELGARNRFEGNTFLITVGQLIKSL